MLSGERRGGGVLSGERSGGGSHWGEWIGQRALWHEREGDDSLSGRERKLRNRYRYDRTITCALNTCAPLDGVVHALAWSSGKPRESTTTWLLLNCVAVCMCA